jgi:ribosomal protein L17
MLVKRHLCDARFGKNLVDASRIETVLVKKVQRGFDKMVTAGSHSTYSNRSDSSV